MDDEELNIRLAAAAPAVVRRDGQLQAALDDVIVDTRPPRRRRKRLIIAGSALSVVLLGSTSAALASPALLDWLGFTPDRTIAHLNAAGDFCSAGMVLRPEGVSADDPSYRAGREILAGIDFDRITVPDDIRNRAVAAEAARAKFVADWNAVHPGAPWPAHGDPETSMLLQTAYGLVTEGIVARGLDPSHVSLDAGGTCDEGDR